jgi:prevent-host-death family protein
VDVGTKELRNRLSEILDRVQRGERVIVRRRGKPAAELAPLRPPPARRLPRRAASRARIRVRGRPTSEVVSLMRDEERS